ncbi:S-layer homology domain-containing protein [Paenibacillus sp.]|uniref:S-layer homology domain-containing protein n=1 Tax=Paenibacillus sp. TaxID=58172 RepID=UPI0028116628|nr:S-layer homology domain-containing protein [Paenibacillus sp.]
MLIRALGIAATTGATSQTFKDVAPEDWYYDAVETASKLGLFKAYGYSGRPVLKSEQPQNFEPDRGFAAWSEEAVDMLLANGIMAKEDTFAIEANRLATRAESAELLYRLLQTLRLNEPLATREESKSSEEEGGAASRGFSFFSLLSLTTSIY